MGLINYVKETKAEMAHVTWPTRKQAIGYSVLVIVVCVAASLYLGLFDRFFASVLKLLY